MSFVTRHTVTPLQRRNQENREEPFVLHIISLDISNGKTLSALSWPVSDPRLRIVPTEDGNFVAVSPDHLTLYSSSFEPLAQSSLHDSDPSASSWAVGLSATRRSIITVSNSYPFHFEWIDAGSLRRKASWTGASQSIVISDDHLAGEQEDWLADRNILRTRLFIRALNGSSRILCEAQVGCGLPAILNQDTLVLWLGHNELKVIETGGATLFDEKFQYDTQWILLPFGSSANGQRFAVPIYRPKGGWSGLDISPKMMLDHVVVYDIGVRGQVYTLDENQTKIRYSTLAGLTLSPNGCELAVLADGVLNMYSLPCHDVSKSVQ